MGRVKSLLIKRTGRELFDSKSGFNDDFERNKKLLKGVIQSKSTRNKTAGYLVKLAKRAKQNE